jgi:hypothetical protein
LIYLAVIVVPALVLLYITAGPSRPNGTRVA